MELHSEVSVTVRGGSPKASSSEMSESMSTSGTGDRFLRWDGTGWMGRDDACR